MTDTHPKPVLGIIGGSGLYDINGLENVRWEKISSPWGEPSDELLFGSLGGTELVFLPRHGRGHRFSPSSINYRANIDVLKRAGVTDIVSLSAVGSFHEHLAPGTFVIVDQFIDRTFAREKSFFGTGMVAHVSMAHPVNARLGDWCEAACQTADIPMQRGGTYLVMEGPQFSTLAESSSERWFSTLRDHACCPAPAVGNSRLLFAAICQFQKQTPLLTMRSILRFCRFLEICKGSFSAVSSNFLTSNTSFFSVFCALSDENIVKTVKI